MAVQQQIESNGFSGTLENTQCPTCKDKPAKRLFQRRDGVGIWQCQSCNLLYASPRFDFESLLKIYENENFLGGYDDTKGFQYDAWVKSGQNTYHYSKFKFELCAKYIKATDRLLDVGCGLGHFCLYGQKQGYDYTGLEPSDMLRKLAKDNLGVELLPGLIDDFQTEKPYKAITLWDVLEHVYDPMAMLKHCDRVLDKNGYIMLQVPNHSGLTYRLKSTLCRLGLKKSEFKHFGFPWHVYAFDPKSLHKMFDQLGYRIVQLESWSSEAKGGKRSAFSRLIKNRCWHEYILCIAQKK